MKDNWKKELLSEPSLYAVIRASPSAFDNRWVGVVCILSSVTFFIIFFAIDIWNYPWTKASITFARSLLSSGFQLSVGVLGFLIAGFAIFATITDKKLFVALAQIPNDRYRYSELKFMMFSFLTTIIHYLFFAVYSIVLVSVAELMNDLIQEVVFKAAIVMKTVFISLMIVYTFYMSFVVIKVKTFIWNLYQTMLLAIVYEPPKRSNPTDKGN